jgi:hypothetical protein
MDAPSSSVHGISASVTTPTAPSSVSRSRVNRRLGLGVLGCMIVLAATVAVLISTTRSDRRLTNLGELPILGYLPNDTNVIAALNIPEAEKTQEGRDTIDRLGFGGGGSLNLEKYVGLPADQIESLAVGLRLGTALIPRTVIVVRTRDSINLDALRSKLGSKGTKKVGESREYDLIQLSELSLECAMWQPSPQTLVICYPEKDFEKVPAEPTADVSRFSQPIAELLKFRTERGTFLWLVAHSEEWDKVAALKLLPKIDHQLLMEIQTVGLGVRMDTGERAKRSRPARISQEIDPTARGIALDLVIEAVAGTEMNPIDDSLQDWANKHDLIMHDSERNETRFSTTITGQPDQWGKAFRSLQTNGKQNGGKK